MSDNLEGRVSTLEAHRENDSAKIKELAADVKAVLGRINWALGGMALFGFILTMAVNVAMKVLK